MLSRGVWRALAWLGTAILLVLCYAPTPEVPGPDVPHADKLAHVAAFFAVALAWRLSGLSVRGTLLVGILLILVTEIGQALLPTGRQGDVMDALGDLAGILAAILAAPRLRAWAVRRAAEGPAA